MKNKKGLVGAVLVVLAGLVGGGIYLNKKGKNETETEATEVVESNENNEE